MTENPKLQQLRRELEVAREKYNDAALKYEEAEDDLQAAEYNLAEALELRDTAWDELKEAEWAVTKGEKNVRR